MTTETNPADKKITLREWPPHDPILDDIFGVHEEKPLGYLPISTIKEYSDISPEELSELCRKNGLKTLLFEEPEQPRIVQEALYVYDDRALQLLIDDNLHLLEKYEWPTTPYDLVQKISTTAADSIEQPDLYRLIAYAFADPRPKYQRKNQDNWSVPLAREGALGSLNRRIKNLGNDILKKF